MADTAVRNAPKNKPNKPKKPSAKAMTKAQVKTKLAEQTGLAAKQIGEVLDGLTDLATAQLKSVGVFTVPGLVKLTKKLKPATAERQGIDPFTKQPKTFKAKPASNTVRSRPLKAVKDAVA